jgi:hypothetical protein
VPAAMLFSLILEVPEAESFWRKPTNKSTKHSLEIQKLNNVYKIALTQLHYT